jgi:predicted RNase H-like nuclease (RuvC/YqgF family)
MTKPGDSQTKKTIQELSKEFPEKTYRELEKYRDADRVEEAIGMGHNNPPDLVEVMAIENDKLKKRAQEAEGELSILKGLETNRVKEAQARSEQLQDELDRTKKENNDLYNKIADLTEALKSKDYFEKPDYKFLVNENHRLEQQYLEVMADNKKLAAQIEDRINQMRKSGM